jgi:hypothetical protein
MSTQVELNNDEIDVLIKDAYRDIRQAGDRLRGGEWGIFPSIDGIERESSIIVARIERIKELEALKEKA